MGLFKPVFEEGQTIVLVPHSPENVAFFSRTLQLLDGKIVDGL